MNAPTPQHDATSDWQTIVSDKVNAIRFGVVQIVVHEGKVTQIESTEKTRLDSPSSRDKKR